MNDWREQFDTLCVNKKDGFETLSKEASPRVIRGFIQTTIEDKQSYPMGVSQWATHGRTFGYWSYFASQERDKIIAMIEEMRPQKPYPNASNGYNCKLDEKESEIEEMLSTLIEKLKLSNEEGV